MSNIRVVIWNECRHEKKEAAVKAIYPNGLHATIKEYLDQNSELTVFTATLDDPHQGLPDELLEQTDVLVWWGHVAHEEVSDELVQKIRDRVYQGKMGFVALHSAHRSKPFCSIVGTNGNLSWGKSQKEIVWNLMPSHEIAAGIPDHFLLESEEMYGEPFYIPQPDALVFGGWFEGGNLMRSGACFHRGAGKLFYFQPGHETDRSLHNPYVLKIIENAIKWAKPNRFGYDIVSDCVHIKEKITDEF